MQNHSLPDDAGEFPRDPVKSGGIPGIIDRHRLYGGGASLSILGVGAGMTRSVSAVSPKDVLIDGPRAMRDLLAVVRGSDARVVLLHLPRRPALRLPPARGVVRFHP